MGEDQSHVLIIEDDEDIASALSRGLGREGYRTSVASHAKAALDIARMGCDAAIVDMMLGAESGADIIRTMRSEGIEVPIVILSALSGVGDRTLGLEAGADDYVVKPFEFSELVARLRVQENRHRSAQPQFGNFDYDESLREVRGRNRRAVLTEREGDLLSFFLNNKNTLLTRGEIFDGLWAEEGGTAENVVDVYIGYLRRKLSPADAFGIELRTVRGRGFILTETTSD